MKPNSKKTMHILLDLTFLLSNGIVSDNILKIIKVTLGHQLLTKSKCEWFKHIILQWIPCQLQLLLN